jgi:hypothetical protein
MGQTELRRHGVLRSCDENPFRNSSTLASVAESADVAGLTSPVLLRKEE